MKKLVRLTESDLHGIIKEYVKKVLKETDLPGGITYKNPNSWRDVPNTEIRGEYVYYNGKPASLRKLENELYNAYREDCIDLGGGDDMDFSEWVKWQEPRYLESFLKELTYGM